MKKILFLVAFFSIASMANMNAQTKATDLSVAMNAAKTNPDIIQKVGSDGAITFKQKSVCSKSGKVSYKPVSYNAETKSWAAAPASCSKGAAKSCAGKKGGKACCAGKKGKSCCAGKKSCSGKNAKSCSGKKGKSCSGGKCGSKTTGAKS